jgi:hypothetical protein
MYLDNATENTNLISENEDQTSEKPQKPSINLKQQKHSPSIYN